MAKPGWSLSRSRGTPANKGLQLTPARGVGRSGGFLAFNFCDFGGADAFVAIDKRMVRTSEAQRAAALSHRRVRVPAVKRRSRLGEG
jgi:hypothetical protein